MKYIDTDKLREKIYAEDTVSLAHGSSPEFDQGCHYAFLTVLSFIDSLQQEQPESSNGKFVFPNFLYARTTNNKTIDVSYAPQSLDAVEYIKNDAIEQPKVDLEKVIEQTYHNASVTDTSDMDLVDYENIARHFFELGQQEMRHRITNPEYNTKVVEQLKSEYPIIKEE